nr:unnamed protein product [Callosobruchus analis]
MQRKRDQALVKYRASKAIADFNYYKILRNEVNYAIVREKKAYLQFQLNNKSNIWNELRDFGVHNKKNTLIADEFADVSSINCHFLSFSSTNNSVEHMTKNFYETNKLHEGTPFEFSFINKLDVCSAVLSIKSNAAGVDGISIKIILHCCPFILPLITHIYNFCITNKVFPNLWKKANVIPLPKKDTVQDLNDLRPVSVLCALSKPLGKLLENQIREYVNYNEIFPRQQSGFRTKHSYRTFKGGR